MSSQLSAKTWIVYKHTSPSNKVYIGITSKSPTDRWASGFGYEHQVYFFRAIVKYGWINFKHEILFEGLTKEEAEKKEIELIAQYNSTDLNYGYNIDLGGDLHRLSAETRQKMSDVKKGRKWTERQRLASIEYFEKNPGKKIYKYDKQGNLIQEFKCAKEAYVETGVSLKVFRTYMSTKRFPHNWEYLYSYGSFEEVVQKVHNPHVTYNAKPIDMYDLSLNYIRTFASLSEAGKFLQENVGLPGNKAGFKNIWKCCNGKKLTYYNYIWRYHNENQNNKIA